MNWEAIGAIAELLGAIGVIASLVYLATQIRHGQEQMSQNTRALQAGAYQQFEESVYRKVMDDLAIPGLERIIRLGMADIEQLSEEDMFRWSHWIFMRLRAFDNSWIFMRLRAFDNSHYQFRMGMQDEDRWQISRRDMETFFQMPGVVQWWKATPSTLSPDFVALVEEILGEEAEGVEGPQ
jgi:hypothetical protein